jgi:hypothetical protein
MGDFQICYAMKKKKKPLKRDVVVVVADLS